LNNVVYVYSYKELENKKVFEIEYCEGGVWMLLNFLINIRICEII
jgi:hypothetical protein